jgi:hypothetical protein
MLERCMEEIQMLNNRVTKLRACIACFTLEPLNQSGQEEVIMQRSWSWRGN